MKFIELNNNKEPLKPLIEASYSSKYEDFKNAGVILGKDIIVLDFDGDNNNESEIIKFIEKNYPTLCVTTNRRKHFYYKMPTDYKFNRSIKATSVLGFICDYLTGEKGYAMIKQNGKDRKMNKPLNFDNLPILPKCLYPLYKAQNKPLSGLCDGDGRNNKLFSHLLAIREAYSEININEVATVINKNIFSDKLNNKELNNIIKSVSKRQIEETKNYNKINKIEISRMSDLQKEKLPPITFFVENIFSQGLVILSSLPKIGKSFMALDLGISIASGSLFLGFKTTKAGFLYLALEDSKNRLQDRLNKVLKGNKVPSDFFYTIKTEDMENGLIKQLEQCIKDEPSIKVIVIDTLQKVRSSFKGNNNYANDYKEIGTIKEFADKNGLCIILIHHTKKGIEDDVFNKVSGTNGITGTADTTIVLNKKNRSDENTFMSIVGRDVEFQEYALKFDKESFKWKMISTVDELDKINDKLKYDDSSIVKTIKTLIDENKGEWKGILKDIKVKHKELFSELSTEDITKKKIAELTPLLKKYDNIDYYENAYPIKGKRLKVFKKL